MKRGIDVSTWQEKVDWPVVKSAGIEFVMIRAGFAETRDNMFDSHIAGAAGVGLPVGVYWFSYALNEDEARIEARTCLEVIKPHSETCTVAYDFEYASEENMKKAGITPTRELATAIIKAFCDEIAAVGYNPMVYTNPDMISRLIDIKAIGREVWLAAWQNEDPPKINKAAECRIWQYKVGTCEGIAGNCDLDIWYNDAEIEAARAPAPEPEPEPATPEIPAGNTYTVKSGDTLWGIAEKLLGNGSRYQEIMALNGLSNDVIYTGQALKLPDAAPAAEPEAAPAVNTYTVKSGDTPWGIAEKYLGSGLRYTEIMALNGLPEKAMIYVGQVLKLPEAAAAPAKIEYRTYTVKAGDTLWGIATAQLGDGTRYDEIMELNDLADDVIYAGQTLKLPKA